MAVSPSSKRTRATTARRLKVSQVRNDGGAPAGDTGDGRRQSVRPEGFADSSTVHDVVITLAGSAPEVA